MSPKNHVCQIGRCVAELVASPLVCGLLGTMQDKH